MHVSVHLGEVDLRRSRRDAEGASIGEGVGALAGGDQRFRGHAAGIEAFAAHLVLFDQHDRYAERGRSGGDREAARARADDTDVGLQTFRHAFSYLKTLSSARPRESGDPVLRPGFPLSRE